MKDTCILMYDSTIDYYTCCMTSSTVANFFFFKYNIIEIV